MKNRIDKVAKTEKQLHKMKELYQDLINKICKKRLPEKFTDKEVDIMAEDERGSVELFAWQILRRAW